VEPREVVADMVEPLPEVLPMEELPLEAMAVNSDKKHLTKFSIYL